MEIGVLTVGFMKTCASARERQLIRELALILLWETEFGREPGSPSNARESRLARELRWAEIMLELVGPHRKDLFIGSKHVAFLG